MLRQDLCRAPKRILPHIYEASTSFLRFSIPPETDTEIFFQKGARHKFLDCERGRGTLLLRKRAQKSSAFPELLLLKKRTQKSKSTEKSGNKGGESEVPDFRDSFSPGLSHQKTRQKSELQIFILHGKTNSMAIPEYPNFGLYVKMVLSYG